MSKWYWTAVFSGFFDNATESKTNRTLREFFGTDKEKGWFDDDNLIPELITNYTPGDFNEIDTITSVQSARYKAILNLLTINGISDFGSDRKRICKLNENQLNDHHIFPKGLLHKFSIKDKECNSILNRTLITTETNLAIKDESPSSYMKNSDIVGSNLTNEELLKHCIAISTITDTFSIDVYRNFIAERKKLIIKLIRANLQII